jgi:7-cyano-7-deazaguanine synthase
MGIDLGALGGSALTDDIDVPKGPRPKGRGAAAMTADIPITYVPARNTVFLALALAWAELLPADDIFIGVNAIDYSGYPDCRPEFIAAFERLANLATKAGVAEGRRFRIHAPLIDLTKGEIIRKGRALGVDYALTSSCYDPAADGRACGTCDACRLRLRGFAEAGMADPIAYVEEAASAP